jgi:hypothetical protein
MVVDEVLAGLARSTGLSLQTLFLAGYVGSLLVIWTGLVLIGTRVYRSPWAVAALAAAFTMRHRIPRTSVNSFEPYFSTRMLAFGIGMLAIAAVLHRRPWVAIALVGLAAPIHVTTALWFAVLLGTALAVLDARLRRVVIAGGAIAVLVLVAAVLAGPLQGTITRMDDIWLQAVASKDSLFATDWPAWAWAANLGFFGLLWWAHRVRAQRGEATLQDRALVWGAGALVALFLVTLPFVMAGMSLAVQFQISRVFWLVDLLALVYVVAAVCDKQSDAARTFSASAEAGSRRDPTSSAGWAIRFRGSPPARSRRSSPSASEGGTVRGAAVAIVLLLFAVGRGLYVMVVERPERPLFEVRLPGSPWEDAMAWLRRQPADTHVLADPGHGWKYATSVRVSAERDVLLEEVKDSALAIYSRDVAARFVDRVQAVGDFASMSPERAQELARRYDLDFLVTEADLALPLAYSNDQFRIYSLR